MTDPHGAHAARPVAASASADAADHIVSTELHVAGVRDDDDVKNALQALYDVFTEIGLGQATFELTGGDVATLWVKHRDSVTPDRARIDAALRSAGSYRLAD